MSEVISRRPAGARSPRADRSIEGERGLHRELDEARRQLRVQEHRAHQFLVVLGHELRNPLAGIDGGIRLLRSGAAPAEARRTLDMMERQVGLLTRLLDDLLDVSRIARGELELRRRPVSLGRVVESAVAEVSPAFEERGQRISAHLPGDGLTVEADPDRMEQVVSNLLLNASKFSDPRAEILVDLRRAGDDVVLEVRDPGSGIDPDMLDEIFEPFIQVRQESPLAGGLGIGLALVRQLVELHGGSVSAASDGVGCGSTFQVRLPTAPLPSGTPGEDGRAASVDGGGRSVLVIDDNEDAARALAQLLELRGCRVATATTGSEGLEAARALRPDAVLLDLDLPDLSGYQVAEELRRGGPGEPLLIAVSGFGHEQARERSRRCGIDHHLVKPVEVERLLRLFAERPAEAV